MSDLVYRPQAHSYVLFNSEIDHLHGSFDGPCAIIHMTQKYVWVSATYSDELHPEIKRVGTGDDNGYDESGNCIVAVPHKLIRSYLTEEEAASIWQCMDADYRLYLYAIG